MRADFEINDGRNALFLYWKKGIGKASFLSIFGKVLALKLLKNVGSYRLVPTFEPTGAGY